MRIKKFFLICFFVFCLNSYPQSFIFVDNINKKIYGNFSIKDFDLNGDVNFSAKRINDSFIFNLNSENIKIEDLNLKDFKFKFIKKDEFVFIKELSFKGFLLYGKANLLNEDFLLNIIITDNEFLKDRFNLKAKLWGSFSNPILSGTLTITDGKIKDIEFKYFILDFFGSISNLNITDARVILKDGSSYRLEGLLDIKNINNISIFNVIAEKIAFGEWKLLEQSSSVALRKDIDEKFDISFLIEDSIEKENNAKTELRYKVSEDDFLKFRLEDKKSIIGLEKRKEF